MKKQSICLYFIFISYFVSAQQLNLIVKGGTSLMKADVSNYYYTHGGNLKTELGISGSMGLEIGLSDKNRVFIQSEINFTQKGYVLDNADNYKKTYKLNYLELPVLLKFRINWCSFGIFINGGPAFGYMLGGKFLAKDKTQFQSSYEGKIIFTPTKSSQNDVWLNPRTEISLHLGGGISLKAGNIMLQAEGRYINGFTKIQQDAYISYGGPPIVNFVNRGIIINLGAAIPLSKSKK